MSRLNISNVLGESSLTGPVHSPGYEPLPLMPSTKVLKIGGQSIMDRGKSAVFPILKDVVALKQKHNILLGMGGGTRARHIYTVASELELPTGVLAHLGGYVPRQNARMVQMLLADHGGIFILYDDFEKLPLYFKLGCIPIMTGMPPFGYWEKPTENGRIPQNRTDAGVYLTAEALGCKRVYYIKDENGLYTDDPKKNKHATHIPRISAQELIDMNLSDLVIERVVLEYMTRAQFCHEVQIINGLNPLDLTRALDGEDVGTIIYKG